ncbi:uncharacterized protein LOC121373513 [Gigantopelta aegis]|uniref:uncharacterized protein LOC121373513 n=1 Tax=Gigantopelta aegis TaxID=1735272 RepID=UPI001B889FFF|nr:uncharacterized protein LOC121373513 [Gigantopelta aegis]
MESSKPKRKPNWTEDETLSLVRLVDERKDIIRGKFGAGVTSKKKKEAWLAVTEEINAAFPSVLRTSEDCEKRWYNVQCRSRKEISTQKTHMQGTGGGPVMNLSGIAEAVYDVLGHSNVSISGVDGGLDSSLIQVIDLGTSVVPQSSTVTPSTSSTMNHPPATVILESVPCGIDDDADDRITKRRYRQLKIDVLELQKQYLMLKIKKN